MRSFISGLFLVILLGGIFVAFNSVFIVDERQTALVVRLGEIRKTIDTPGLNLKYPFVEDVILLEKRILYAKSPNKTVQVSDGKRYEVDAITMYKIVDPQKFRETVQADIQEVEIQIGTLLDSALRDTYTKRDFSAALSKERAVMMREIRDELRQNTKTFGIEVIDVRIVRTDLKKEVLKQAFDRMKSERQAEAAQLIADGGAEKQKIMAEADREATEIKAKAQRQSEIFRGQGDAQRNKIFAEAFSKDPEFFAFYRSMFAYRRSLLGEGKDKGDKKGDTTLVLSPDSEFFRYLKNPTGQKPAQ